MPRCARMKRKSAPGSRSCSRSTSIARISLMRLRIVASSASHSARSSGEHEHGGDDLAAVRRRVRVVGADDALQLRQHARGLVLVGGDDGQRADALAVERERLRERARHEQRAGRRREAAHDGAVGVDAVAEALVGEVEERHEAARADDLDDPRPLRGRRVDAGRIVAARVQHDDRARREPLQRARSCRRSRGRAWPRRSRGRC